MNTEYEEVCSKCNGKGTVGEGNRVCLRCKGTGGIPVKVQEQEDFFTYDEEVEKPVSKKKTKKHEEPQIFEEEII